MRRLLPFALVLFSLASPAAAQTLAVDAEPAHTTSPAPSQPPPSRRGDLTGWMGVHLFIGAGEDWTRALDQLAVLPTLDFSVMVSGFLRLGYRVTHGALSLVDAAGDEVAFAQTFRNELAIGIESDVGPYVGARVIVEHAWDLPADANGDVTRTAALLGLDAGVLFRLDPLRVGLSVSYVVEPDASYAVLLGIQVMGQLFDAS
jgi:hypothetical protein